MTEITRKPELPVAGAVPALDGIARRTLRLDLASSVLTASTIAVLEMGGALAKRGYHASDVEVAFLTSGQSLGLILSFFIAHLASTRRKMPLVFWPEAARSLALALVFLVSPPFAIGFVICHAAAQMFQSMTVPARVTIYRFNYPSSLRGRIVGRNRQVLLILATVVALVLSVALEWGAGLPAAVSWLGEPPISTESMLRYAIPIIGILGLCGSLFFRAAPVREDLPAPGASRPPLRETLRSFVRVWRRDREFRRYENFFFLFGFANIMTIPLTQIHAVDVLHANYFDLALINVALVQGVMALTMGFWGRLVDRYPPAVLRGVLNMVFSIDLLILAVAPSIEWVYAGRVARGIALGGGTLVWMLGSLYYARTPEEAPIYLGIHTVLTGLRWALAPFVGVWLKAAFGHTARPIFLLSFVVVVVTAAMMIRTSKTEERRRPTDEAPPMPAPRTPGA
jgi:MFS transporter